MEINKLLENQVNKYISDKNRTFLSVGRVKRDFSIPKNKKKIMLDYILTRNTDLYIIPVTNKPLTRLAFDLDNCLEHNIHHQLSRNQFYNLFINVILTNVKRYFNNENLNYGYIISSHSLNYYKYHITFPNIKITREQGLEIWELVVNDERLLNHYTSEELNMIVDKCLYRHGKGLAYPYQEKEKGSGYYMIDPEKSTFDISNIDIHKLMNLSVKKNNIIY